MRGEVYCWEGLCCLEVPNNWTINEEDGIISLTADDGVGALQLSFAMREKSAAVTGAETIMLAKSFAESCGWAEPRPRLITIGGLSAAQFDYHETDVDGDTYWCVWCVLNEHRAATITYNCKWMDRQQEEHARNHIIASFKLLSGDSP